MRNSQLLKEKVKARMLQNAARLWGADDADIELNFDPLVTMLIEGCVNEVEKINNEIENTQVRLLNRLADLMVPDVITGSLPAHAIAHAKPNDSKCIIKPTLQFYYEKKIPDVINPEQQNIKEIFFSPAFPVKLTGASLKYFVFKDRAYEVNGYQKKIIVQADNNRQLDTISLWLAVDLNNAVADDLADLSFYFDLKNNSAKNSFLALLPAAKWSMDGKTLKTAGGLADIERVKKIEWSNEFDPDKKIESGVRSAYYKNFISVIGLLNKELKQKKNSAQYPEEFHAVFTQKDLQKLTSNLRWIKIEFPYAVAEQFFADVVCNVNCFPVVNKRLNESVYQLSKNVNVIALKTNENFFSLRNVIGSDGFLYTDTPKNMDAGSYILRQGGVARFDKRNALEMINYLLDLLREESAAFTRLGNEFVSSQLSDLNRIITLLEQNTAMQLDTEELSPFYLMIKPQKEDDNIFVSFWTTNGELANNIKAGNPLELLEGGEVQGNNIVLMSTTTGGRNKLSDQERINAFRASMISRGRIVTAQDIIMFCKLELGKEIEDIKVKKGFMIEEGINRGFVQTTDVLIKVASASQLTKNEWIELCDSLENKLMQHSNSLTTIRVLLSA